MCDDFVEVLMIERHHFREDGLVLATGVAGSICGIQPIEGKEYYI